MPTVNPDKEPSEEPEKITPVSRSSLEQGGCIREGVTPGPGLSSSEVDRLTDYKRRYNLEARGFTTEQAQRLLFMEWLYTRGSVKS